MALQLLQLPLLSSPASSSSSLQDVAVYFRRRTSPSISNSFGVYGHRLSGGRLCAPVFVGTEDTEVRVPTSQNDAELDASPEDLEYISQIKRVLELLRKNRDMLFGEVKLTIMIEDPREVERRRLLGIEDADAPTRDDLAAALEEVNEGKIPKNRIALKMLAAEMMQWPNLEVEAPKKKKPSKSLYAKATDTGINPEVAAKRLNIDWDSAADFEDTDDASDDTEVPPAVGYGALYLVTAFPIIIGISVVLILFYNSLQ